MFNTKNRKEKMQRENKNWQILNLPSKKEIYQCNNLNIKLRTVH